MRKPECPICHAAAVSAGKLRYCAQCGWQKKQTETQLRLNLKMVPIVFGIMTLVLLALFFRSGMRTQNAGLIAFFLSFPLIALCVSYLLTKRNLKILLAQPVPVTASNTIASMGGAATPAVATPAVLNSQYEALLRTSPPRKLRLSRRGKFNLTLTLSVLLIFAGIVLVQIYKTWALAHSFANFRTREWGMLGFAALLLLMLVSQWRAMDRERHLLANGEVASAKIVQKFGSRNASAIKYEFEDYAGQKHISTGADYSQRLEEGMSLPVFYDRGNPKNQVPACGTYHEVVLPSERQPEL